MAFCFKRKESVAKGVRRLARGRIENSLECLNGCHEPEAVHCARKEIKKARAVLRLVRPRIGKKAYGRRIDLLREAATHMAPVRDADVNAQALKDLVAHFKAQLASGALRHARTALREAADEQWKRFSKQHRARSVGRILRRVGKKFDNLGIGGKGWKVICPGVKGAYAAGKRAYSAALKTPTPENFHEWRKRAKDLWYQVRMLCAVWPQEMEGMAGELETLGEYLGDDHDLVMLRQAVQEKCGHNGDSHELEIINGLIDERQRELRRAALGLGARLYAEKPSAFVTRLRGYSQIWRRRKDPSILVTGATSNAHNAESRRQKSRRWKTSSIGPHS